MPSWPTTSLHSTLAAFDCLALLGPIAAPTSSLTIIGTPSLEAQFSIASKTKFKSRSSLGFISSCSGLRWMTKALAWLDSSAHNAKLNLCWCSCVAPKFSSKIVECAQHRTSWVKPYSGAALCEPSAKGIWQAWAASARCWLISCPLSYAWVYNFISVAQDLEARSCYLIHNHL